MLALKLEMDPVNGLESEKPVPTAKVLTSRGVCSISFLLRVMAGLPFKVMDSPPPFS